MNTFFYTNPLGRAILKLITKPGLSRAAGTYLSHRSSRWLIRPFIHHYQLDLTDYPSRSYNCFNDFFTRRILPERRPLDPDPNALISPCDGLMSVYAIDEASSFCIKDSRYTVSELLQNDALARQYEGGYCIILRLTVSHYHRYCYPDTGTQEPCIFIPGILHTVRPIAHMYHKVFKTNAREYTVLHTEHHGDIVHMEVGATFVGRIANEHRGFYHFYRGEEKGHFEFGGSTIVLFVEKNRIEPITVSSLEIPVQFGEAIGYAKEWRSLCKLH